MSTPSIKIRDVSIYNGNDGLYCAMCNTPAIKEVMLDDSRCIAMCRKHFLPIELNLVYMES